MTEIVLPNRRKIADLDDALGVPSLDLRVGSVAELTIPGVDDGTLRTRGGLVAGSTLRFDGAAWEIAAIERDYRAKWANITFTARSRLARRLRNMTGPSSRSGVTPAEFIGQAVKRAGGSAWVEPGARRRKIVQKRNESMLDVITSLASDTGVEWVEFGNRLLVATPWAAYQGRIPGLLDWPLRITGARQNALAFTSRSSLDDRQNAAEAQAQVLNDLGQQIRPWHRVVASGASDDDNGVWLVRDVSYELRDNATTSLTLYRPLKSAPKKGTTGGTGTGDAPALELSGDWIEGKDKLGRNCTRTPAQYVAWAKTRVGTGYPNNRCLQWVSEAVSGRAGRGGKYARYVWEKRPPGTPVDPGNTKPPIGAIVVWNQPTGEEAGHIGISIGGGKMISATGGSVGVQTIATFGRPGTYYGAMAPDFYV